MTHKYKVIRFVNNEQVCEWKEEEIDPILYLNDFYNFIDKEQFDNAWGHGQGRKDEIYDVLKKHLKALEIIKETWGDSILCDIEKGFIIGYPYTKLPDKEKIGLLKEVLL